MGQPLQHVLHISRAPEEETGVFHAKGRQAGEPYAKWATCSRAANVMTAT